MRVQTFRTQELRIYRIGARASILLLLIGFIGGMASTVNAQIAPPVIFFSDLQSGPNGGGDSQSGFSGAYVTLYGNNFGPIQGTGAVTLGGANCLRVVQWGSTWLWYQKIIVQLGSSCGSGNFSVTTLGGSSNPLAFTVRPGNIYCVSTSGNDSNTGRFPSSCWSTVYHSSTVMNPGDTTYVENGVLDNSGRAYSSTIPLSRGGTAGNPVAYVVYPGATATIGDIHNVSMAIRTPNIGVNADYTVFAGLNVRGNAAFDISGGQGDNFWLIGNDLSCDGSGQFSCIHFDVTSNVYVYGNNVHDIGYNCSQNSGNPTGAPCKFHGVYFTTNTNHVWMGWNLVDMNPAAAANAGCNGIQFYSTGGGDQFDLHVFSNTVRNSVCGGLTFSTVNPSSGPVEAYNNVFTHDGTGPDPSGTLANYSCINIGGTASGTVQIYNNTLYDCGSRGNADGSNAALDVNIPTNLTNNTIHSTGSSELYLVFQGSGTSCAADITGAHNNWFGNGAPPCASQLTGNLNVDPKSLSVLDLHLQALSNLVDAASPVSGLAIDHDGISRPQGAAYDIGAYEYFSGGSTVQKPNPPTNLQVTVQ